MKKFGGFLFFVVVLLGAMYFTNPTLEDFSSWVEARIKERVHENEKDSGLGDVLGDLVSGMGAQIGSSMTDRHNYHILSLYEIDMGKKEYYYLGIFKTFLPLQTDNPLDKPEE